MIWLLSRLVVWPVKAVIGTAALGAKTTAKTASGSAKLGSRTGKLELTIPGQPVSMRGQMRLTSGGPGTIAEMTGDLKVAIPLLGKKLERAAAPAVLAGFNTQQKVGNDWLARGAEARSVTR